MTATAGPAERRIRPSARTAVLLGLLMAAAFVIRIDALRNSAPDVPALGDARAYHLLAANLAEGKGYIRPYEALDGYSIATAEYPPGLPVVLAVATKGGISGTTGQRVVLCGFGALTVGLVGLIGRRLGGDGAGFLAAGIAAVYPALWNSDVSLMAEPLAAFMGAALVLAALWVADQPALWRWVAFGALAGLGVAVRSEFLLLGPALLVMVVINAVGPVDCDEGDSGERSLLVRRLGAVGLGLGALVVTLVPWTVRNAATFDALVPLSNNSGSVSRGANCDAAYQGQFKGLWVTNVALDGNDADVTRSGCFAGFDLDWSDPNEADAASALRADGMAYTSAHLSELPGVMAARVGRTVGLYQFDQQSNFAFAEGRNATWERRGTRSFQFLAVLGIVGLALAWVRKTGEWRRALLVLPPAVVVITVALTYGNPRFRAAAEPAVVVLAALGIMDLASWRSDGSVLALGAGGAGSLRGEVGASAGR